MTDQMKQENARVQQFYNRMDKRVGVEPWNQDDVDFLEDLCELKYLQESRLLDKYGPMDSMSKNGEKVTGSERKNRMYTEMARFINHKYVEISPITGHKAESVAEVGSNLHDIEHIDRYIEIGEKWAASTEKANDHFRESAGVNFMEYAGFYMNNGKAFHKNDIDYLNDSIKAQKDKIDDIIKNFNVIDPYKRLYADVYKLEQYVPKMLVTRLQPPVLREDTRQILGQDYVDYVKEQTQQKSTQKHYLKPEPSVTIENEQESLESDFDY